MRAIASAAADMPTKNGTTSAPWVGRSAPSATATDIVPGPVVNGSVSG